MMTLEEYREKKKEVDQRVLQILKDDSDESVAYDLHCHNRRKGGCTISLGIFRKYENLQSEMDGWIEFSEIDDGDGHSASDECWFEINKYRLENGKYKVILSCRINFDGELLHYLPIDEALQELEIPNSRDVIKPYETGDILMVKNIPLSDDFYVIYIYDEKREGNQHLQMNFDDGISFTKIHWLEITEKVETCPVPEINEMSKKMKENDAVWRRPLAEQGISHAVVPF